MELGLHAGIEKFRLHLMVKLDSLKSKTQFCALFTPKRGNGIFCHEIKLCYFLSKWELGSYCLKSSSLRGGEILHCP